MFVAISLLAPKLRVSSFKLVTTRLMSSRDIDFNPPQPPSFVGTPVFPDIDIESTRQLMSGEEALKRNGDENSNFVVTGASRGIGLQIVKSLVDRSKGTILACCRSPKDAQKLHTYLKSLDDLNAKRVHILQLDVESTKSIAQLGESIKSDYSGRVDGLYNVAGILGDGGKTTPGPERSITKIDPEWMQKTMSVNFAGPLLLSQALVPMMFTKQRGKSPTKGDEVGERGKSVIANLSARVGSISDNGLGGWYSYRCSKAALNQATRTMAHELRRNGVWTISLHPGTTETDLSKPFQKNVQDGRLFPVEFTVKQLLDVVDSMEEKNSGGFYDWAGKALPF
eukprot:CAMPEP_0184870646 /NCGR_PEP_ID=MMETSP0580-20130426/38265_1 /TAXON_ID=1118495 /ORGANISM="Dactyliosolen fragilissimus" /LENGTH=338 /DNA_ID=CAMNT_0027372845 /DNA_START=211 /DNA_END=1227 /DNA_ORIENTATION=+